jgi:S1-C subfamily serine protease
VAVSQEYDLALLKIHHRDTPSISAADAYRITPGTTVYAVGSPLGIGISVSSGVVSGTRGPLMQTNAQINPGNSGGPLITEEGRVIGINTSKIVGPAIEGIGFALPVNIALDEFGSRLGPHARLD